MRWANPVAPSGEVATAVMESVPGGTGMSTLNEPSPAAVVVAEVAAPSLSTFMAVTSTVASGTVVPATVTDPFTTSELFTGEVRVTVMPFCVCVT